MIWLVMGIMVLGGVLFVLQPLYVNRLPETTLDNELAHYLDQITVLEDQLENAGEDKERLEQTRIELKRQVLASKGVPIKEDTGPPAILLASMIVVVSFSVLGLYVMLGRAELTRPGILQKPTISVDRALAQSSSPRHENDVPMAQLVEQLAEKLDQGNGGGANGWMLYARSLMNLGRYKEAIRAYEKVLSLTGNNPNVAEELDNAEAFIAQQNAHLLPGPDAEDLRAAAQVSAEERTKMIEAMVDGLSQKLRKNPIDTNGWIRLLKARKVLGQPDQMQIEIERMKAAYKNNPQVIAQILDIL